jgi:hypothetical protein
MRFNVGEVWKSTTGLRAAIVAIGDDGHEGKLFFEDGAEQTFKWMELTQRGLWQVDTSARPTKTADELKALVLAKIAQHPVCPEGWDIVVRPTGNGNWAADHISPHHAIGYADCANYAGGIVRCFGLLFALQ